MGISIVFNGKGHQIHGGFGNAAHGVDVAQGIAGGNLTECIGIIHNRREKINGLNQGQVIGYTIDAGVIRAVQPDQHIGISRKNQSAQRLLQVPMRQFGSSSGTFYGFSQSERMRVLDGFHGSNLFASDCVDGF
jgi:hypothetical protein